MIGKSHGEGLLCVKGQMEFRPKILRQPILLPIPHFLCVCHKLVPDTAKYLDFVVSVNLKSRKAKYPTTNLERWTKNHEQRSPVMEPIISTRMKSASRKRNGGYIHDL